MGLVSPILLLLESIKQCYRGCNTLLRLSSKVIGWTIRRCTDNVLQHKRGHGTSVINRPGAKTPGNVGIGSKAAQSRFVMLKFGQPVFDIVLVIWVDNFRTLPRLSSQKGYRACQGNSLLEPRSGVLQPMHVTVLTANFISPPIVGVAICIVRVWSPATVFSMMLSSKV